MASNEPLLREISKLNHSVMNKKFVTCHPTISYPLMDPVAK